MYILFAPQKDIATAREQVLEHVREFLPIMARAAHSSLSNLPVHQITMTDEDFEDESLMAVAVGEDFEVLVNFGPAPRVSCLSTDSEPATVGIQKVTCTYLTLSGGSYWEPPDMVEHIFFEGQNLEEALEALVLLERREAIRGTLESYQEAKALAEMAEESQNIQNAARFHAPGSTEAAAEALPIYTKNDDQPVQCPECSARTDFEDMPHEEVVEVQRHVCLGSGYKFLLEFELEISPSPR